MTDRISGGCLCGRVRIAVSGEPYRVGVCHCLDCRKHSGAPFQTVAIFPEDAVSIAGEASCFEGRYFCPTCGSRVLGKGDGVPGLMLVCAGTLDDPALFEPTADIFTRAAPYWDMMDPVIAKWPQAPED